MKPILLFAISPFMSSFFNLIHPVFSYLISSTCPSLFNLFSLFLTSSILHSLLSSSSLPFYSNLSILAHFYDLYIYIYIHTHNVQFIPHTKNTPVFLTEVKSLVTVSVLMQQSQCYSLTPGHHDILGLHFLEKLRQDCFN